MRESFIFYKSFYNSIKELDPLDQVQIYNAIFEYQFNGEEIELNGVCKSIFTLIIPQLQANNKRYENGRKGGRPKTKAKPKDNQNETKAKPNVNDNVNDNVIIKENIKRKVFAKPTIEEIKKYCEERNNGINAEAFYDFYESKNWYVGKNKMQDWKACVRTWEKRNQKPITKSVPEWLDKEIKRTPAPIEKQKEMEEFLNSFN